MSEVKEIRIIIIGSCYSGITSFIEKYIFNSFDEFKIPTIGTQVYEKNINKIGKSYLIKFIDISIEKTMESMYDNLFRLILLNFHGCIFISDARKKETKVK